MSLEAVQLLTQPGLNHRHTAGSAHANWARLAVCQGFMKAACAWRGMRVNSTHMYCVYVCLGWTLICTSPFICGQSVASCSTNCTLSMIVPSALEPSQCAKQKPCYNAQISCEEHLVPFTDRFIDAVWHWSPGFSCGSCSHS